MKPLTYIATLTVVAIILAGCAATRGPYYQASADMTSFGAASITERQSWKDINPRAH